MYEVTEQALIDRWAQELGVREIMGIPDPKFSAHVYGRGEAIITPLTPLNRLLMIAEGSTFVYTIREDGVQIPVATLGKGSLLGDVEFYTGVPTGNYVEARSQVICLGLSLPEYRDALHRDVRFLHTLLDSFHRKLSLAGDELASKCLEDRLVAYMRALKPANELHSVEAALYPLHCSRRQLQRVLKKLCESGTLVRLGKGCYRLDQPPEKPTLPRKGNE